MTADHTPTAMMMQAADKVSAASAPRLRVVATPQDPARTIWDLGLALHNISAALPDPAFASKYGMSGDLIDKIYRASKDYEKGLLSPADGFAIVLAGYEALVPAWAHEGGPPDALIFELNRAIELAQGQLGGEPTESELIFP